jgi:cell wall-associated NlpC family hydrolase
MNMHLLFQYAFSFVGRRYTWGGDDPMGGYDCSGYVQELLMAAGVVKRGTPKMSASMLFDHLSKNGTQGAGGTGAGAVAFFGPSARQINHVGFCLDPYVMLHAASGDSTTTTEARAIEQNAFVRLDPIRYRKDFLTTIKPTYLNP